MDFIGRQEESQILTHALAKDGFSAVLLYGRRRVGKSELIRQFLEKVTTRKIVFEASKTIYSVNFSALVDAVSQAYQLPLSFGSLEDVLTFIGNRSKTEKTVLVIDEYSYFRRPDGLTESTFQHFIDDFQHESKLTLILSGSLVRIMLSIIDNNAPLYGRFTDVISLEPFDYDLAAKFYPNRTPEEKLFLYGCFGGVPHYLSLLDAQQSVEENLIRLFFSKNAVLQSEADLLLSEELSSVENANAVLTLLGSRHLRYSDINQLFPDSRLNGATYILKKLVSMSLVEKEIALNSKDEKNATYAIKDPFLRFYYSFYVPTRSYALLYSPEDLYQTFIKDKLFRSYLPHIFELVSRQFLIRENRLKKLTPSLLAIGSYTYTLKDPLTKERINSQFDVVTKDSQGYTDYECKYYSQPLKMKDIQQEKDSIQKTKLPFDRIGFFSKSGFSSEVKALGIPLYSLDDLYR
jgi:AAA+ ATPase superfamily predicted ATPase